MMTPRQLDIFDDARDTALRNDMATAVLRDDLESALVARALLEAEFATDALLGPADQVIAQLRREQDRSQQDRWTATELAEARRRLESAVAPNARTLLGGQATDWLARRWRFLAGRAGPSAWPVEPVDVHAAALHLAAGDWAEAAVAVATIPSWRRIPQPLLWMTEARWRQSGAGAGWPLLAEACWLAPHRAGALLARLNDRRLDAMAKRFGQEDLADDGWDWFPAWALTDHAPLAETLAAVDVPAQNRAADAFGSIAALLRLERQGRHHEVVAQRKRLKSLSEALFAVYMRTR